MKRLYKSSKDKKFAGVCGGVAEYFNIDSVIIRGIFAILFFVYGVGFLPYIVLAIVMPYDYEVKATRHTSRVSKSASWTNSQTGRKDVTESLSQTEDDADWSDF